MLPRTGAEGRVELAVDLWLWPLAHDPGAGLLSPAERARAARFVRPADAVAYRAAHAGLREILGAITGQAPAALAFEISAQGKPLLPGGPAFNLSHSGGWAALAVAPVAVGVDIEAERPVEPEVATRFFSAAEQAALAPLAGAAWRQAFFRIWTRKEAFVKALGLGLSHPLDSFDVTADAGARLTRHAAGNPADWALIDLPLGPGWAGAVAVQTGGSPARVTLRGGAMPLPGH